MFVFASISLSQVKGARLLNLITDKNRARTTRGCRIHELHCFGLQFPCGETLSPQERRQLCSQKPRVTFMRHIDTLSNDVVLYAYSITTLHLILTQQVQALAVLPLKAGLQGRVAPARKSREDPTLVYFLLVKNSKGNLVGNYF